MGTLCREPLDPSIQDLKVTLQDSTLVFPSQETENRSIFLSNIDQVLNFYVQTIHFFPANPDFTPEVIASRLKTALEKVLVPYDFVAGRLKHNPQSSRLEVECNAAGAGFVVASTQFSLDEIGDLVYPNPAFRGLIVQSLDNLEADNQPLCIFQVLPQHFNFHTDNNSISILRKLRLDKYIAYFGTCNNIDQICDAKSRF